jgi:hypothetical protein
MVMLRAPPILFFYNNSKGIFIEVKRIFYSMTTSTYVRSIFHHTSEHTHMYEFGLNHCLGCLKTPSEDNSHLKFTFYGVWSLQEGRKISLTLRGHFSWPFRCLLLLADSIVCVLCLCEGSVGHSTGTIS